MSENAKKVYILKKLISKLGGGGVEIPDKIKSF